MYSPDRMQKYMCDWIVCAVMTRGMVMMSLLVRSIEFA